MRGKVALWLANLILIIFVAITGHYGLGLVPLALGLALLGMYSTVLALTAAGRLPSFYTRLKPVGPQPPNLPFVSLLVPAHNEERVIAGTLESLLSLSYTGPQGPAYEIIVIDDRSTDRTSEVVARVQAAGVRVRLLRREAGATPGKSAALNDALPLAHGEIIGVFDADARVEPDFLQQAVPPLLAPGIGAVQAQKRIANARGWQERLKAQPRRLLRLSFLLPLLQDVEMLLDTAYQTARGHGRGAVDLRGNGMLVKREALVAAGGWNNETLTDDLDLSTRLHAAGWEIVFCPQAVVWEEGVLTLPALIRQRRRWVEGCIRRYLDYWADLVRAPIPAVMKADALLFALEFVLPMWLFFSAVIWLLAAAVNVAYDPAVTAALALGNVAITLPFVLVVIRRQVTHSPFLMPLVTLVLGLYLLHWLPVIIWTTLRLVALRPQRSWAKTEHLGEVG